MIPSQRCAGCSSRSSDRSKPSRNASLNTDFGLGLIPHVTLEFVTFDNLEFSCLSRFQVWRRSLAADNANVLEVGDGIGIGLVNIDRKDATAVL